MKVFDIVPVKFEDDKMLILDQTKLPGEEVYIEMKTKEDVWDAIFKLKVRGAPAIGVAAAYGLYISTRSTVTDSAAQTVSGQSIAAGTGVDHGCIIEVSLIDQDDSILGKY